MNSESLQARLKNWLALTTIALFIGWVWLAVLPRLQQNSALKEDIEFLDEQGIDPSALYYTDLEAMSRLEAQIEKAKALNPKAFWYPSNMTD